MIDAAHLRVGRDQPICQFGECWFHGASIWQRCRDCKRPDTGWVCHARGWDRLRAEDCGVLWEHLVLETLVAAGLSRIHFWRDKQQREVDFVLPRGRDAVDVLECKWNPDAFELRGLTAFRAQYPKGKNYIVCPLAGPAYERRQDGHTLTFLSPAELRQVLG